MNETVSVKSRENGLQRRQPLPITKYELWNVEGHVHFSLRRKQHFFVSRNRAIGREGVC
jgi:hypothetical protein